MTTTTEKKTVTITLSERSPVKIDPEQWPIIASAETWNGQHKSQANYIRWIKVREHTDGRRIIYGVLGRGNGGAPVGWRGASGGYLLSAGTNKGEPDREDETIRAIRRVAGLIDDSKLGDECIADLPAQEI
jgi:hypothetical protein